MTDLTQTPLSWDLFLKKQSVYFDNHVTIHDNTSFDFNSKLNQNFQNNYIAPLTDLGLISFSGKDATNFLHNQLTNEIIKLDLNTVRLAGYCNPKGRLLATVLVWKKFDHIILQLPYILQSIIQKRLGIFILRSQVKIMNINKKLISLGLIGNTIDTILCQWFPTLPSQPYSKVDNSQGTLIRLVNSRGLQRYQWITSPEQAIAIWPILIETVIPVSTNVWHLTNIYAGIPTIDEYTQEQFIPQMINLELIHGINFKKGCYPGQEIIARTQYLGKIKRRTVLASINTKQVNSGMEVFCEKDSIQPCGTIVNAAKISTENWACLVVVKLSAINNCIIHLGNNNGPLLQLYNLPYNLK